MTNTTTAGGPPAAWPLRARPARAGSPAAEAGAGLARVIDIEPRQLERTYKRLVAAVMAAELAGYPRLRPAHLRLVAGGRP